MKFKLLVTAMALGAAATTTVQAASTTATVSAPHRHASETVTTNAAGTSAKRSASMSAPHRHASASVTTDASGTTVKRNATVHTPAGKVSTSAKVKQTKYGTVAHRSMTLTPSLATRERAQIRLDASDKAGIPSVGMPGEGIDQLSQTRITENVVSTPVGTSTTLTEQQGNPMSTEGSDRISVTENK